MLLWSQAGCPGQARVFVLVRTLTVSAARNSKNSCCSALYSVSSLRSRASLSLFKKISTSHVQSSVTCVASSFLNVSSLLTRNVFSASLSS